MVDDSFALVRSLRRPRIPASSVPRKLASSFVGRLEISIVRFTSPKSKVGRIAKQTLQNLLNISAIGHRSVECWIVDPDSHRLRRTALMKKWSELEFEIVNTTFLSGLDC
jgi:hypothetical protein